MEARSLVKISESELLRWIFTEFVGRCHVLSELGLPLEATVCLEVAGPIIELESGPPGDIDALIGDVDVPEQAVALEAKRVLVPSSAFRTLQPNKLHELRKGARQANGLAIRGFCQAWLLVIVVTDGRERGSYNFIGRGASPELIELIDTVVQDLNLRPEVGVLSLQLTQPVDRDFTLAGGVSLRVVRRASSGRPSARLTEAVRLVLQSRVARTRPTGQRIRP